MATFIRVFVLATMFAATGPHFVRGSDDFAQIARQRVEELRQGMDPSGAPGPHAPKPEEIAGWLQSQQPDGSWPDIDYADQTRGGWKTLGHLSRTAALAVVCARERAAGQENPALREAILRAFRFWTQKDFRNPNWWNNDIGAPVAMERIMLLMETEMDAPTRDGGMKILNRLHPEGTGQNLVWENAIQLDKALLTGDFALARASRDIIFRELRTSRDEGIQPDFSFHQHGPQQQMGNYGLAFAHEMIEWAYVLRGTSLALAPVQLDLLRDYLLQGEAPVVWRGTMDIGSCGRQLFPHTPESHSAAVLTALGDLARVDPAHAAAYQAAAARDMGTAPPVDPGIAQDIAYYTSDYLVHRRAGFAAYLKLCSRRVIGTELVNNENLSGRYLADGALWLYESGGEEEDIFPVLDWRRIPGVTCTQAASTLKPPGKMDTDFAGGVSDGVNGAAGLDSNRDGVTAKKSWFFLGDRIVCLGADIIGTTTAPVFTSIDQRLPPGAVVIGDAHGESAAGPGPKPVQALPGVRWICAGTRGYVFAWPQTVSIGTAAQTGSWQKVFTAGPPGAITRDIFFLWLDHGTRPQSASYAYTLLPASTPAQVKAFAAQPRVEILSNTPVVQAIRDRDAHLVAAIFYTRGAFQGNGRTIGADQSCALLLHEDTGKITVADPTEKEIRVTITIGAVAKTFNFPGGDLAGKSTGD